MIKSLHLILFLISRGKAMSEIRQTWSFEEGVVFRGKETYVDTVKKFIDLDWFLCK